MASASTNTLETLVTIKVTENGTSRRFKLPLRELGINVFESRLRAQLGIAPEAEAVFERYSDSAAAYVVLDQANTAVYKQLNRAAKAKLKLKIRATVKTPEPVAEEEKKGPKPASVEDENEEDASAPQPTPASDSATEPPQPVATPTEPAVSVQTTLHQAAETDDRSANTRELEIRLRQEQLATLECARAAREAFQAVQDSAAARQTSVSPPPAQCPARTAYAVCCNSCDRTIPEAHYHCSTCDDGDFDLCQDCVDHGITCNDGDHWLIKRFVKNGVIINSTTERIPPKPKVKPQPPVSEVAEISALAQNRLNAFYSSIRTCNSCVQELPEVEFVHCTTCEDFDLCRACFAKNRHGHHPRHAFVPAVEGTRLEPEVSRRLSPGRSQRHNAICDGCDEGIEGIRHKCLDCPDWDYCSTCYENATFIHPGHRFVPIYEPLEYGSTVRIRAFSRQTHVGICCDGPLCSQPSHSSYIVGDRYKCAVCHDTDFCANCEASPANTHNKTHPLIKFKTPVRHVSVTTSGEHENGRLMPTMGDRHRTRSSANSSRATETEAQPLATNVMTVVDVKPDEPVAPTSSEQKAEPEKEIKVEETIEKPVAVEQKAPVPEDLVAVYVHDTVADGTVFGPDRVFEQTWVLRNEGTTAWPAGCAVRYVGGDYMGHVDSAHPAATEDLESTAESNICYSTLQPGETFAFSVLLRTPHRSGRFVSNWRLTTKDGIKFGHRLWCDIVVQSVATDPVPSFAETETETVREESPVVEPMVEKNKAPESKVQESQMIFPKLDKESPGSSVHRESTLEAGPSLDEEFADCAEDEEWDDSEAYLTDEEYDILDASDEEYHEGQVAKK